MSCDPNAGDWYYWPTGSFPGRMRILWVEGGNIGYNYCPQWPLVEPSEEHSTSLSQFYKNINDGWWAPVLPEYMELSEGL